MARTGRLIALVLAFVAMLAAGCGGVSTSGEKSIFKAAESGDDSAVRYALSREGFYVNTPDRDGRTLLHHAVIGNQPTMVEALVDEFGSDVSLRDKDGLTARSYAEDAGYEEIVWIFQAAAGEI